MIRWWEIDSESYQQWKQIDKWILTKNIPLVVRVFIPYNDIYVTFNSQALTRYWGRVTYSPTDENLLKWKFRSDFFTMLLCKLSVTGLFSQSCQVFAAIPLRLLTVSDLVQRKTFSPGAKVAVYIKHAPSDLCHMSCRSHWDTHSTQQHIYQIHPSQHTLPLWLLTKLFISD